MGQEGIQKLLDVIKYLTSMTQKWFPVFAPKDSFFKVAMFEVFLLSFDDDDDDDDDDLGYGNEIKW